MKEPTFICVTFNFSHLYVYGIITIVSLLLIVDDGTGVISCHMKRDESKAEKIDKLKSSAHNDSSFMVKFCSYMSSNNI